MKLFTGFQRTKAFNNSSLTTLLLTLAMIILVSAGVESNHAFAHTTNSGGGPTGAGSGNDDPPSCNEANRGDPVGLYTGRWYYDHTDLAVNGVYPIVMKRRYDNQKRYDSPLGYGWGFTYDRRLYEYADGSVILRLDCGIRKKYIYSGGGYVSPVDIFNTLVKNPDNTYTVTYRSGREEQYDIEGKLTALVDPQGNRLEMSYDPLGNLPLTGASPYSIQPDTPMVVAYDYRLIKVEERLADGTLSGNFVDLTYHAGTGRLDKITASDGREVSYVHDATDSRTNGNLLTVNGLTGVVSSFEYNDPNDAHNVTSIQVGANTTPYVNEYNQSDRVIRQTHGLETWDFNYIIPGIETGITQTIKAPDGSLLHSAISRYEFNQNGYATLEVDALGNETRTTFNPQMKPTRTELWQNDLGTLTIYQAIDRTFDPSGNELTRSVTLDSGEIITRTRSYDQNWLASEETVSSLEPGKLFRTEYTFYYDANNRPTNIKEQKRRQSGGSFITTTYVYDAQGRLITTQLPDGVEMVNEYTGDFLTKTYYRDNGSAISTLEQRFEYDARGNRNKHWDGNNNLTQYEFDDRGRMIKQINALNQETIYTYDVNNDLVQVEVGHTAAEGEGQVTKMTYDGNHNLIMVERKNEAGGL